MENTTSATVENFTKPRYQSLSYFVLYVSNPRWIWIIVCVINIKSITKANYRIIIRMDRHPLSATPTVTILVNAISGYI